MENTSRHDTDHQLTCVPRLSFARAHMRGSMWNVGRLAAAALAYLPLPAAGCMRRQFSAEFEETGGELLSHPGNAADAGAADANASSI